MKKFFKQWRNESGQVVMISTVLIGGAMLAATAIAGFVLFYEIRQLNDSVQSATAIYAADSGIEDALYCYYFQITDETQQPETYCAHSGTVQYINATGAWVPGNASYSTTLTCYSDEARTQPVACNSKDPITGQSSVIGFTVNSTGHTAHISRNLEAFTYLK